MCGEGEISILCVERERLVFYVWRGRLVFWFKHILFRYKVHRKGLGGIKDYYFMCGEREISILFLNFT